MRLEIVNAKEAPPSDAGIRSIVEMEVHPRVKEWLTIYVDTNLKRAFKGYKRFFKNLPKNRKAEVLLAKYNGKVVAFLVLWRLDTYMEHVATIGVTVHPDYWGRRITTRLIRSAISLAKKNGIKRLEIETLSNNRAMRRAAEKTGFKLECVRRARIFKNESYRNEVAYSMLL